MSEIHKCEGIVLKKVNYGDSSVIITFFTDEFGKITALKKGARSPRSKTGNILDYLNVVQIVFYSKQTRDVQLISQASLLKHFTVIKNDLEKYKYALAVIELLERFSVEEEKHERLYKGTVRILELMDKTGSLPLLLFTKYFVFFLKEIGYEITLAECAKCGAPITKAPIGYNFETGALCEKCMQSQPLDFIFTQELYELFKALRTKDSSVDYSEFRLKKLTAFFEKFLMYTHTEFKGLRSLKFY